jgi:hypothetical protein
MPPILPHHTELFHIRQGSHDAVVLDFWVRAKTSDGNVIGRMTAASNEGSPAAIKRHGGGPHDTFQFEIDGEVYPLP